MYSKLQHFYQLKVHYLDWSMGFFLIALIFFSILYIAFLIEHREIFSLLACLIGIILSVYFGKHNLLKANYYTDKIDNVVNKTEIVYKPVQQKDLIALNTVTQTEEKGKNIFFISSYHSSDDYYFRYAVKTKFGYQIKKMKVEDKKVYIKETNTDKPRFVKLQQQYKNKGVQLYEQRYDLSYEGKVKYQFIVPKGTVENSYDVKLR